MTNRTDITSGRTPIEVAIPKVRNILPSAIHEKGMYDRTRRGPYVLDRQAVSPKEAYFEHIQYVVNTLADCLREVGFHFEVTAGYMGAIIEASKYMADKDIDEMVKSHEGIKLYLLGIPNGVMHRNQIQTACEIMAQMNENPKHNISLVGPTQIGKTVTLFICLLWGLASYLRWGKKTRFFYLMPNKTGLQNQSEDELKGFCDLYNTITLSYNGQKLSLREYLDDICPIMAFPVNKTRAKSWRKDRSIINKFHKSVKDAQDNGEKIILLYDESHQGHADHITLDECTSSVMRRMIGPFLDELVNGSDIRLVGVSATPYPCWLVEVVRECTDASLSFVCHKIDPNYHGFNFWMGRTLDPEINITSPDVISFEELAQRCGEPGVALLFRNCYKKEKIFEKTFKRKNSPYSFDGNWEDYHRFFLEMVAHIIRYFIKENTKKGLGGCMRLFNNNKKMSKIIPKLQEMIPEIELIPYYADKVKLSVKNLLSQREDPERPYFLIATGGARMSDSFPSNTTYFIDFTDTMTTHASQSQGLIGRACGYHKNSLVVVSKKVADSHRRWVREKGYPHKTAIQGTVQENFIAVRGSKNIGVELFDSMSDPVILDRFKRLRNFLANDRPHKVRICPTNLSGFKMKGRPAPEIYELLLDEEFLCYLEENYAEIWTNPVFPEKPRFLRWGELTDEEKNFTPKQYSDKKKCGFRIDDKLNIRATARERHGGTLESFKTVRGQPGGRARGQQHQIQIVFAIDKDTLNCRPRRFGLLLKKPLKPHAAPSKYTLPDDTSFWWDLLDDATKALASQLMEK